MANDDSLEREVWRSNDAKRILDDPVVKSALDEIQARIIDEWRKSPIKDVELREKLWMMYNVHHAFKDKFREHIETGKLAEFQLRQPKKWGVI